MSIGTKTEYLFAIVWMFIGNIYYGYALGQVTNLLAQLDSESAVHTQRMELFLAFATRLDIAKKTALRVT